MARNKKDNDMYKSRTKSGRNNISGLRIAYYRKKRFPKTSQRMLADLMQIQGIDMDKNAIQRIESGQRFVTDIELCVFVRVLEVSYEDLLGGREDA